MSDRPHSRARVSLIGFVALLLGSTAIPISGHASTYTLDTDPSGTIGTSPFGTITTTVAGSNLDVTVNVSPNFDVTTGNHWALTFDLATSGLSITGLPSPFVQETGSSFINDPFNAKSFNYAIGCNGSYNGMNSCAVTMGVDPTGFSFVIVGAGALSPVLTDGVYFTADIYDLGTGKTGVVGASSVLGGGNQGETPLPAALPLFASGLGVMGFLARRRKRKVSSAIAV